MNREGTKLHERAPSGSEFGDSVTAFQRAWQLAQRPTIEDFVSTCSGTTRQTLLFELAHVDLEQRLAIGERARVEAYLSRFPEMNADREGVWNLIRCEYAMRRRQESQLNVEEYAQRFSWCVHRLAEISVPFGEQLQRNDVSDRLGCVASSIGEAAEDAYATIAPPLDAQALIGSRFRILRPHAPGGRGEVFVARDEELGREVALKQIKPQYADEPESRRRFVIEAEITGGLEHPGVVPVYSLGAYGNGRPFYAMRFIRGHELENAIDRFHKADENPRRDRDERAHKLRQLLRSLIDVCNAVEYAHARGVLHRDLKPRNIMLGDYGETLVVDWGMAKMLGRANPPEAPAVRQGGGALQPPSGSDSTPTQMGAAVGTPQYMSPEQAAGRHDELGPASDVYSLGATLYQLLTGEPPHTGLTTGEVLYRAQRGEVESPRQVEPQVPQQLDAICRKAMAFEPKARYASPRALADDLEHWLADEPVSAAPDRFSDRVFRLARRHRSVTLTIAAASILIAVVASVATLLINEQRRVADRLAAENLSLARSEERARTAAEESLAKEKRAREEADRQVEINSKLAQENERARDAAEDATRGEKKERERAEQQATENERLAKQQTALADSERRQRESAEFLLGAMQPEDPTRFTGATFFAPKADVRTFTVLKMLEREVNRAYNELDQLPLLKAAVLDSIGDVCRQLAVFNGAERLLTDALQIRAQLLKEDDPDLATSRFHTAWYYHERGEFEKAKRLYLDALKTRRKLPDGDASVAHTLQNLAWLYYYDDSPEEMDSCFDEAIKIREHLLQVGPAERQRTLLRDAVYTKLGAAAAYAGQERMLDAKRIANDPVLHRQIVQMRGNEYLSQALRHFIKAGDNRALRDPVKASEELEESLDFIRRDKEAAHAGGADRLGEALELPVNFELAHTLVRLKQPREAEKRYRAAIETVRKNQMFQIPLQSEKLNEVGELWRKLGKASEADQLWKEYLEAQKLRFGDQHKFFRAAEAAYQKFLRPAPTQKVGASLR